jgi:hypothetical protein
MENVLPLEDQLLNQLDVLVVWFPFVENAEDLIQSVNVVVVVL